MTDHDRDEPRAPGEGTADANLSTEHQRKGDAKAPSDTLDRGREGTDDGGRKSSLTRNA